jgi:hypothetical protein
MLIMTRVVVVIGAFICVIDAIRRLLNEVASATDVVT